MKVKIFLRYKDGTGIALLLIAFFLSIPVVFGSSPNDDCFVGGCHSSTDPIINRTLYDSNPHKIIKCISCHTNSIDNNDSDHGHFIRQLNGSIIPGPGSNIGGPLTTLYSSQSFSLCYACHNETKLIGALPSWNYNYGAHYSPPVNVSSIGTNFLNTRHEGYTINGYWPANIHWDHLDAFGVINMGKYDYNKSGQINSFQTCPTCHNVHGTNYPKMTKNDMAITYGNDSNGTFGYMASNDFAFPGGDLYCGACHGFGEIYKYYRQEINLFDDCISCHIDNINNYDNISLVNRTAFSQGVHHNINTTADGILNNNDCWTCHYKKNMSRDYIRKCEDCHIGGGTPEALQAPKINTHVSGTVITNYSCVDCHSKITNDPGPGIINVTSHYLKRPTVSTLKYCDYCHGPNASSPFPALNKTISAFNHDDPDWNSNATCKTCHSNSSVSSDPLANDTSSFHDLTSELGDVFNQSASLKADCVFCHVLKSPQFVAAPNPPHDTTDMEAEDCRGCHTTGTGTPRQKLHSVTAFATGGCIPCHSNNETRYYVNTSLFGRHVNVNLSDGPGNVTDDDCKTCHFGSANGTMKMALGAANSSNTYFCDACHTTSGNGPIHPPDLLKDGLQHGSTNCHWCHIAGDPLPRPLINENETLRYHPNGPKGTALKKNCLSCHYSNLPDLPFHAPGEVHPYGIDQCKYCHGGKNNYVDNHTVWDLNSHIAPTISGLSVTTPVTAGNPAQVQATTVTDGMTMVAAAQYQVKMGSIIVIDWTNMTPIDGWFNSSTETMNAIIDTSILLGNYTVNVKGMASAPKTNRSMPYYPLNGIWSSVYSIPLYVTQPPGYVNGTVTSNLGKNLSGVTVSAETGISATTEENGFYSINLENGVHQLTASKEPEYYSNSSLSITVEVSVNEVSTVNQDIVLSIKSTGRITGKITNAS